MSNGPGDPAALDYAHEAVRGLMGKTPIFGICLGHQVLGYAFGGRTFKLKFGHRGGNQPVKDLRTGKVAITSQNHGFAVDAESLPPEVEVTHVNLNDGTVEGMRHRELPIFSVQYHPEAAPGPARRELFLLAIRRADRRAAVATSSCSRSLRSLDWAHMVRSRRLPQRSRLQAADYRSACTISCSMCRLSCTKCTLLPSW